MTAVTTRLRHVTAPGWAGLLGLAGVLSGLAATGASPSAAGAAAAQIWPAFVLVTGLLLVGLVAAEEGLFDAAGAGLARVTHRPWQFFMVGSALIVVVTATLNLDTAAVFLTPALVAASRTRDVDERPLLYGSLLLVNAGSLFLPGSNLTNLIVVGTSSSGLHFLGRMWLPAISAVVVTGSVLGIWARRLHVVAVRPRQRPAAARPSAPGLGAVSVAITLGLVLLWRSAALAVLGVGCIATVVHLWRRRLTMGQVREAVSAAVLVGLFGLAVAMGTLGRTWSGPAAALSHLGMVGTAIGGAVAAVVLNNLPAAALLASRHPEHPAALLIGLNLGPNLCVTGSLAWYLWWRMARVAGADPSLRQAMRLGAVAAPLAMTAALVTLFVT